MKQRPATFRFKHFEITDNVSAMKIGTDGVILGAWAFLTSRPDSIIDVGTGSGLIALMMAQRFPNAAITAIEIDPEAAAEASANVDRSPWSDRVNILTGDFITTASGTVDAVISNPPFFTTGEQSPTPARAHARHATTLTVDSLLARSAALLGPGGRLALIAPAERLEHIIYRGAINHLDASRVSLVMPSANAAPIRVMVELTKGLSCTFTSDRLILRNPDGSPTDQYRSLTSDFYINLK